MISRRTHVAGGVFQRHERCLCTAADRRVSSLRRLTRMRAYVAVVGGARASAGEERAAEQVGRGLATAGAIGVCGGRGGVMGAFLRARQGGGGTTSRVP